MAFLGFSPGFPYLVGLAPPLAAVGRRATPRPSVPAGSVASPAGSPPSIPSPHRVDGCCSDGRRSDCSTPTGPLSPSCRREPASVRPSDPPAGAHRRPSGPRRPSAAPRRSAPTDRPLRRVAEVVRPGLLSLVQDTGRGRRGRDGRAQAGPADAESMALANRLVGNADGAAALEITGPGRPSGSAVPAHCAVVGAARPAVRSAVDPRRALRPRTVPSSPWARGRCSTSGDGAYRRAGLPGRRRGLRHPGRLGSRSSDVLCGLGPGPLAVGDRLALGRPTRPHGLLLSSPGDPEPPPGRPAGHGRTPRLGRAGLGPAHRGSGGPSKDPVQPGRGAPDRPDRCRRSAGTPVSSTGMVTGAVQVPPDGNPIVLMPDHATVGGYPVDRLRRSPPTWPSWGGWDPAQACGSSPSTWTTARNAPPGTRAGPGVPGVGLVPHPGRHLTRSPRQGPTMAAGPCQHGVRVHAVARRTSGAAGSAHSERSQQWATEIDPGGEYRARRPPRPGGRRASSSPGPTASSTSSRRPQATTFPVTAPENATPLEEEEPEGVIPPSPLWAMKDRRHEQWFHLGHPERIRACVGTGDAAVYAIDDGSHHCMIGRRVGATVDGCVYSLVARVPKATYESLGAGRHRRREAFLAAHRGRAERHRRGSRRRQRLRRGLLPAPRRHPRRLPSAVAVHRIRRGPAHRRSLIRPGTAGEPPGGRSGQPNADLVSSRPARAAAARAETSGPAPSTDRDALASTEPGGTSGEERATSAAPAPWAPTPGARIDAPQVGRWNADGCQRGPDHRPDRAGPGAAAG